MIPQRNISIIANKITTAGGYRIPETVIERDYVLAWFLTCMAGHRLRDCLAFKGGTALRRCWIDGYRFSEDLDFTLTKDIGLDEILAGFSEIYGAVKSASGVQFDLDRKARRQGQNSHTFYLRYLGPLPAPNDVKVDITISETICFPLQERPILRQFDEFDDLPDGPTVLSYSLEEVIVEKIEALSNRARNEPRDLYDLWYLLNHYDFWLPGMQPELEEKFEFRSRSTEEILQTIDKKEERLRRLWQERLAQQVSDLPAYDRVFREVRRALRAGELTHSSERLPEPSS